MMQLQRASLFVLAATAAPALAQLPAAALSEASLDRSQLMSIVGVTSLAPAAASVEASILTQEASAFATLPLAFSVDEKNYSDLASDPAAQSTYSAFMKSRESNVFGAAATTTTTGASTSAPTTSTTPSRVTSTTSKALTSTGSTASTSTGSKAPTSTASKGAAPTTHAFGGALGVLGLVGAALL